MNLIKTNIKLIYNKNKIVFWLITIIQIIIVAAMLYTVAKIQSSKYYISSYNEDICTYSITSEDLTVQKVQEHLEQLDNSEIQTVSLVINSDSNLITYAHGEQAVVETVLDAYGIADFDYAVWSKSREAFLSVSNLYSMDKMPSKVDINGMSYTVKAVTDSYLSKNSIVPYHIALEDNLTIKEIRIQYSRISGKNDMNNKLSQLTFAFSGMEIDKPVERNYAFEEGLANDSVISMLLIILSLVCEVFFYAYLIKKCFRDYAIFELCGATKSRVVYLNVMVVLLLFLIQFIAGCIVFKFGVLVLLNSVEPIVSAVVGIECYAYSFIILMAAVMITFFPVIRTFNKYQVKTIIKEVGV